MTVQSPAHRRYFRLAAIRATGIGDAKVPQKINHSSIGEWVGFELIFKAPAGA